MSDLPPEAGGDHERVFRDMLPFGVASSVWSGDGVPTLLPVEAETIRRAIATRREEFARGRACARAALETLGVEPIAIPVGESRAPVWPSEVVGSITHTAGFIGAAVARASRIRGVGIDVEKVRPLEKPVRERILVPSERDSPPLPEWDVLAFSAKESIHKVVFPMTGVFLDFQDVSITLDLESQTFRVEPSSEKGASAGVLPLLSGSYRLSPPYVMTVAWVATQETD